MSASDDLGNRSQYRGMQIHAARGLHERCAEIVCKYIPRGSRTLDIAAGSGAFIQRLLDLGYQVQANDLDHVEWSVPGVRPMQIDLNQNISPEEFGGQFDVVVAMEVLEHLENPLQFLRNLRALCKDGGYILLTTPNTVDAASYLRYIQAGRFMCFDEAKVSAWGHIGIYPYWLLETYYRMLGFRVIYRCASGSVKMRGVKRLAPLIQRVLQAVIAGRIPKDLRSGICLCYLLQKTGDVEHRPLSTTAV